MLKKKGIMAASFSVVIASSLLMGNTSFVSADAQMNERAVVAATGDSTLADMPAYLKSSVEWVWKNRMLTEGSTNRKNIIFDQIFAGKGTLNYVVRWQSSKRVTLKQRQDIAKMLDRQMNHWTEHLQGYDGWPYKNIKVKVVGWAVADPSLLLDKQPDEVIYTDTITDVLASEQPGIPAALPVAPNEISRFEHFTDPNYSYPGGLDKRFDMYLWATENFGGGAGGDWGQRMNDDYILSTVNADEIQITEHEIGHGFGLNDFYEEHERPPGGFPTNTIMWAGNSNHITDWDIWMLRYTWSQLKKDTSRFPSVNNGGEGPIDTLPDENVNIAPAATASTSYTSPWENISALNDGFDPANSTDRSHAVYGNWPETGTQWVQYDFDQEQTVSQTDVYWFKDGGGIDVPKSYKIKYWNGRGWSNVKQANGLGTAADQYNTTTFTPVKTTKLRIEMASKGSASTGILEWKVAANKQ
ncbi:discoidin domain-containing protein [Paenibacillus peoriae]|uniref:discoidin domain-containing protein n=2 Tax=Paenibacillus TaxID=44249 RepID=UPI00026C5D3E|nr:discoidin domain-containing protein [Paenibacillus peoriae]MEC0181057.1 discoidin domain-containing protein [Paenibacillus peoriae]